MVTTNDAYWGSLRGGSDFMFAGSGNAASVSASLNAGAG